MNATARNVILSSLLLVGCSRDATTELQAWKAESCACKESACAEEQRREFWRLVQEFRDEAPSAEEARRLDALIHEGQLCLEEMSIDLYAIN